MALIESKLLAAVTDVKIKITYWGTRPVLAGYVYQLKSSNPDATVDEKNGDNTNSEDDIYSLPTPVADNVGRKVRLVSSVTAIDDDSDFTVQMDVIQDGQITDTLISPGHVNKDGESVESIDIIKFK